MNKILASIVTMTALLSSSAYALDKSVFIETTSEPFKLAVKKMVDIRNQLGLIELESITSYDMPLINYLSRKYEVKSKKPEDKLLELLSKIDYVPSSYVVSKSAIATGWGGSRSFRKGNLYSQFCNGRLCKFDTPQEAAESMVHEIAVSDSWKSFRTARLEVREQGLTITGQSLIYILMKDKKSRNRQSYSIMNKIIIKEQLDKDDGIKVKKIEIPKSTTFLSGMAQMEISKRKKHFIAALMPIVHGLNKEFISARSDLNRIQSLIEDNKQVSNYDKAFVNKISNIYDIPLSLPFYQKINVLLQKIDIIPPSLIVAHAAYTTGWGTNKMFSKKLNPFAAHCGRRLCTYTSLEIAIFEQMMDMNKKSKYSLFRLIRKSTYKAEKPLSGWVMAQGLIIKGGKRGIDSIKAIQSIINSEGMDELYKEYPVDSEEYAPLLQIFKEKELVLPDSIILSR